MLLLISLVIPAELFWERTGWETLAGLIIYLTSLLLEIDAFSTVFVDDL